MIMILQVHAHRLQPYQFLNITLIKLIHFFTSEVVDLCGTVIYMV